MESGVRNLEVGNIFLYNKFITIRELLAQFAEL